MAVNEEILELVRVLAEEDLEQIAGDLLIEVSAGRRESADPETGEVPDELGIITDRGTSAAEQIDAAVTFLRLRLIEPARRLAEAERLGGEIAGREPIEISFVDQRTREPVPAQRGAAGQDESAEKLDGALERIRQPPERQT